MENEIAKQENKEISTEINSAWGAVESLNSKDVIIPKIYLMQAISKLVKADVRKSGQWVDSIDESVLADKGEKLEVIIFDSKKRWVISTIDPKTGKLSFLRSEPLTEENAEAPYDDIDDEHGEIRRQLQYNYYCLLPSNLSKPYVLSMSKTATNTAKKINSMFTNLAEVNRPSASIVIALDAVSETKDSNEWWGISASQAREATAAELEKAYSWYLRCKNDAKVRVDDSEDGPF